MDIKEEIIKWLKAGVKMSTQLLIIWLPPVHQQDDMMNFLGGLMWFVINEE